MISLVKEIQIHKMLLAGTPQMEIATRVGVSASTVARIARAIRLANEVSERRRRRARFYLVGGLSPEAVSANLDIPIEAVWAIQRSELLLASVVESPHPCPTCGSVMLPINAEKEHAFTTPPASIPKNDARTLFILADEIVGLAKANTVRNMLFYGIADRMELLLASIVGEDYVEEETYCQAARSAIDS